jgi:hypothetical protein
MRDRPGWRVLVDLVGLGLGFVFDRWIVRIEARARPRGLRQREQTIDLNVDRHARLALVRIAAQAHPTSDRNRISFR